MYVVAITKKVYKTFELCNLCLSG